MTGRLVAVLLFYDPRDDAYSARGRDGRWWFIEAGPGSCAGTGHEAVFKAVARRLRAQEAGPEADGVGGPL